MFNRCLNYFLEFEIAFIKFYSIQLLLVIMSDHLLSLTLSLSNVKLIIVDLTVLYSQ